jgi:hypothetical protein
MAKTLGPWQKCPGKFCLSGGLRQKMPSARRRHFLKNQKLNENATGGMLLAS